MKTAEARRWSQMLIGVKTKSGRTVEAVRVDDWGGIWITFEGWGLAPFREACYSHKEVAALLRGEW